MFGVSREEYDREVARREVAEARLDRALNRLDELVEKIIHMRKRGFDVAPPPKKPRVATSEARSDEQIVGEAASAFISNYAADLVAAGADPKVARAEAERVREEIGEVSSSPER